MADKIEIAIGGASGLVGRALVELLEAEGHAVRKLVRREPGSKSEVKWDPARGEIDAAGLAGVQAIINLGGENVGEGRWTDERKKVLVESRTKGTELLAKTAAALDPRPECMINASAVGIYGTHRDALADESAPPGDGFLAEICVAWEKSAEPARAAGIRTVTMRIGVVLAKQGGALAKLVPIFKLGGGGPVGGGKQWMSWISLADTVRAFHFVLHHRELSGPINVVAPNPVDNRAFTKALAHAVHRPAFVPVPRFAIEAMFGQMGKETVLASQNVVPKKLLDAGFSFEHPTVEDALRYELAG